MILEDLREHLHNDCYEATSPIASMSRDLDAVGKDEQLLEWSKCGADAVSALPTLLWALGAAALAQRLMQVLFRRSLFRRVPCWELMLQHMLFVWMVVYSLHFWAVLVRLAKLLVHQVYDESTAALFGEEASPAPRSQYLAEQAAVWAAGAGPLLVLYCTRPRPEPPPLMIWITTSPWQRRELGPHGYYLQRPPPPAPAPRPRMRRAASHPRLSSDYLANKRHSKSI